MSSHSDRSKRIRSQAHTRPDVIWRDQYGQHEESIDPVRSEIVLSGGTQLTQLITESDAHLAAMRKMVK